MIVKWFDLFIQEKQYLNNLSHHTIRSYKRAFKTFQKHGGELTKEGLTRFIIECRKAGMKTVTINTYCVGFNSFLS
jgi:site-specific recombinase XerD